VSRADALPSVNEYDRSLFLQAIKRMATPVFGQGWTVTKAQVCVAFWLVNPDLAEQDGAEEIFDMMFLEAVVTECEEQGYKVLP